MNPLDQYLQAKEASLMGQAKRVGTRAGELVTGSRLKGLREQAAAAKEVVDRHGIPMVSNPSKGLMKEHSAVGATRAGLAGAVIGGAVGARELQKQKAKTAGAAGRFASGLGQGAKRVLEPSELGRIGTQAAIVGGVGILAAGAQKTYLAITKKRDFDAMLEHNPDLAEHQAANPQQFNQHYSSLRSMNPLFAKDPVVAGSYMRQMSMNPGTAGKVLVESLNSLQKGGPKSPMMGGLSAMQNNSNMGLAERKHDFDQDKYEQQLADKQPRYTDQDSQY